MGLIYIVQLPHRFETVCKQFINGSVPFGFSLNSGFDTGNDSWFSSGARQVGTPDRGRRKKKDNGCRFCRCCVRWRELKDGREPWVPVELNKKVRDLGLLLQVIRCALELRVLQGEEAQRNLKATAPSFSDLITSSLKRVRVKPRTHVGSASANKSHEE